MALHVWSLGMRWPGRIFSLNAGTTIAAAGWCSRLLVAIVVSTCEHIQRRKLRHALLYSFSVFSTDISRVYLLLEEWQGYHCVDECLVEADHPTDGWICNAAGTADMQNLIIHLLFNVCHGVCRVRFSFLGR